MTSSSDDDDEAARFVFTLFVAAHDQEQQQQSQSQQRQQQSSRSRQHFYVARDDFMPMMIDIILTHPGLHFLREAPQFYAKYAEVGRGVVWVMGPQLW